MINKQKIPIENIKDGIITFILPKGLLRLAGKGTLSPTKSDPGGHK